MDFPDKQGRSAEEAATYWHKVYFDQLLKRGEKNIDVQGYALIDIIYTLKDRNRFLEKALAGKIHTVGGTVYIDVEPETAYDGSIHNGRYK